MSVFRPARHMLASLLLSCSLSFGFTAAPALAQGLSSSELWSGWQADVADLGGSLRATETREGNRLILRDVTLEMVQPSTTSRLFLDSLTLVNRADGSVGIMLPESFPLRIETVDLPPTEGAADATPPAPPREARFTVAAPGLDLAILGVGEKSSFTARAPSLSVTLDSIFPLKSLTDAQPFVAVAIADLHLRYAHELVKPSVSINAEFSFGTLHGELRYSDQEMRDFAFVVDMAETTSHISAAVPPAAGALIEQMVQQDVPQFADFLAVLDAGAFYDGAVRLGPVSITMDGMRQDQPVAMALSLGGIQGKSRLDKAALDYDYGLTDFAIALPEEAMRETPVQGDVSIALGEFSQMVKVGLNGFKGPQDWAYRLKLQDLEISENLWAVMDRTGLLDHKPMSLLVDLAGSYGITPEVLAPDWQAKPDELPLNNFSFRVNALDLDGLGVKLTGKGGLDFDMKDLVSYGGTPAPRGAMNFVTKGVYGLLDTFIEAGFVSAEEATGFRAGLMMIGKAGAEPDSLTTDLKFEGKSFWLNGMQMR